MILALLWATKIRQQWQASRVLDRWPQTFPFAGIRRVSWGEKTCATAAAQKVGKPVDMWGVWSGHGILADGFRDPIRGKFTSWPSNWRFFLLPTGIRSQDGPRFATKWNDESLKENHFSHPKLRISKKSAKVMNQRFLQQSQTWIFKNQTTLGLPRPGFQGAFQDHGGDKRVTRGWCAAWKFMLVGPICFSCWSLLIFWLTCSLFAHTRFAASPWFIVYYVCIQT